MMKIMLCKDRREIVITISKEEVRECIKKEENIVWVEMEDPTKEELSSLKEVFGLHPLTIEDCINTNARPKIEQFPNYLFLVLHAAGYNPQTLKVRTLELNICVGRNFLLTVHMDSIGSIKTAWERAEKNIASFASGADSLLYLVCDSLVDNYFPVIDMLDTRIDKIEREVFENPSSATLEHIFSLKNDILFLRRAMAPQRDTINALAKGDHALITAGTGIYFRDISDNILFLVDTLESYRDTLSGALDAYLSTITNKTNEIMRTLTIIATIMMPLSVITGIYGMNFRYIPELELRYGHFIAYGIMAVVAFGMLIYFRKNKWF